MKFANLTTAHLNKAKKLVRKKESFLAKIIAIEQELEALMLYGVLPSTLKADKAARAAKTAARPRRARAMSPQARAKIAAAQKRRWAKAKAKA